jgi:hypothetical protein
VQSACGWGDAATLLRRLGAGDEAAKLESLDSSLTATSRLLHVYAQPKPDGSYCEFEIEVESGSVRPDWLVGWHEVAYPDAHDDEGLCCAHGVRRLLDAFPMSGDCRYPNGAFRLRWRLGKEAPETRKSQAQCPRLLTLLAPTRVVSTARVDAGIERLLSAVSASSTHRLNGHDSEILVGVAGQTVYLSSEADANRNRSGSDPEAGACRSPRAIREALLSACEFLLQQRRDLFWEDFLGPRGTSDTWVTAYVIHMLSGNAWDFFPHSMRTAIKSSAEWLARHRSAAGGWGYSRQVNDDADSTGLSLLALRRFEIAESLSAYGLLTRCLQSDGGVSTYPATSEEDLYWHRSSVEVTPIAMLAAGPHFGPAAQTRAAAFLKQRQREDGLWGGYWWVTPLYSTWVCLRWLRMAHADQQLRDCCTAIGRSAAPESFELALKTLCLGEMGQYTRMHPLVEQLLAQQDATGGWPGTAMMRYPYQHIADPERVIDSGACFRDQRGVFTTATAMAALGRFLVTGR